MTDLSIVQYGLLVIITFVAALTQSITGFGFALLTLPFFVLILDVQSAVQLTLLSTFVITLVLMPVVYKFAPKQICTHLIIGAFFGFPLGLLFLSYATPAAIQLFVGVTILVALATPYFSKQTRAGEQGRPHHVLKTGAYGFVSGMMTTSIAMPGPALAFYAQNHLMSKLETRAMIFSVFVFLYGFAIVLQLLTVGLYDSSRATLFSVLVPAIVGTYSGNKVLGLISDKLFRQLINGILLVTALYLLLSNLSELYT